MQHNKLHILRLMIAEFDYYKNYLFTIGIICIAYTIILLTAPELFQNAFNWYNEFWTWCIAVSSYYIMIFIWGARFKTYRDRVINLLPVTLNSITFFRALFSVALPVVFIIYIFLAHQLFIKEWKISSMNLIGFMSKVIVVLPALNILIDMWFINHRQTLTVKIIKTASTATVICSIVVLFNIYILPLVNSGIPEGIIFLELFYGFVLVFISVFVFKKRESFIT